MLIEKCKHLAKASKNHNQDLAATVAENHHDHVSVFLQFLMNLRHNIHQSQPHRNCSYYSAFMGVSCVISLLLLPLGCVDAVGYSYTRFIGPVAGPEHRIYVNDAGNVQSGAAVNHASRLDYVAKPEYEFAYGVEDAEAHILHNRNEMRDGDAVKGVYSVVEPDGTLRVVKYTADEANGFQAEVITNGVSALHGGKQHDRSTFNNNHQSQFNEGVNHPSNAYTPNSERHINHYYPQNLHATPPASPIMYQYNNDNHNYNNNHDDNDDANDNDDDIDSGNDYSDDYQPQYEVHEKQNDKDHKENNDDDNGNDYDDGGGGVDGDVDVDVDDGHKKKSNQDDGKKKKKGNENDGDDNSEDDYDDSDELDDYDEAVRSNEASEESDEYY